MRGTQPLPNGRGSVRIVQAMAQFLSRDRQGAVYASILALLLFACTASAQTLDNAERLWKQHRYDEANGVFRALVAATPKNAEYRVRWGRLLLERFNANDAAGLFTEALELKKDYPPAI